MIRTAQGKDPVETLAKAEEMTGFILCRRGNQHAWIHTRALRGDEPGELDVTVAALPTYSEYKEELMAQKGQRGKQDNG